MKAVEYKEYGGPEVLKLIEAEKTADNRVYEQ